jgi:hypothetical protein
MNLLNDEEDGQYPRGILVHGGSQKLTKAVREEASRKPAVEVVSYKLDVDFKSSNLGES